VNINYADDSYILFDIFNFVNGVEICRAVGHSLSLSQLSDSVRIISSQAGHDTLTVHPPCKLHQLTVCTTPSPTVSMGPEVPASGSITGGLRPILHMESLRMCKSCAIFLMNVTREGDAHTST